MLKQKEQTKHSIQKKTIQESHQMLHSLTKAHKNKKLAEHSGTQLSLQH